MLKKEDTVLIWGDNDLAVSIAVCLLLAKQPVVVYTSRPDSILNGIKDHLITVSRSGQVFDLTQLKVVDNLHGEQYALAIAITPEDMALKKSAIKHIEYHLSPGALLAINTESILLDDIQREGKHPEMIIGANWVQPAHTTFFLEIITNQLNTQLHVRIFANHAKLHWKKDPYTLCNGYSVRVRLMCALIREAFYLVENRYVSVEDIDRACRNDAGYYLPFAGNFRYMDLMGTYIYGLVMQDMNPDLSTAQHIPAFFSTMAAQHQLGMQTGKGFYVYADGEAKDWNLLAENFSYQIQAIIKKYPFNYLNEESAPADKTAYL